MPHILTDQETLEALGYENSSDIRQFEVLINGVDEVIRSETGYDWTKDELIDPKAKLAASLLIVSLHDGVDPSKYYNSLIIKLTAKARGFSV